MGSREVRLVRTPKGRLTPEHFRIVEVRKPEPGPGEVLVRNLVMSVDPTMRAGLRWLGDVPPDGLVLGGGAVGRVEGGDGLPQGAHVLSGNGWREWFVAPADELQLIDTTVAPPSAYLGLLGMPGQTAWLAVQMLKPIPPGATVMVSSAAGAVGSVAVQLAKLAGARVIGIAGGVAKCSFLLDDLGVDIAVDHHAGPIASLLADATHGGVDAYIDNVGGETLSAALECMNPFGQIVLSGAVSAYDGGSAAASIDVITAISRRITIRGLVFLDHADRFAACHHELVGLLATDRLRVHETVEHGLERAPHALVSLFGTGTHVGKLVVSLVD